MNDFQQRRPFRAGTLERTRRGRHRQSFQVAIGLKRFRDDRPSDICFARGTFNSHPYVMGAMNEFLRRLDEPALRGSYASLDAVWDRRARALLKRLADTEAAGQVPDLDLTDC